MHVPLRETHYISAQFLYRQRCVYLAQERCDARALSGLEKRLRVHLHVLSTELVDDAPEPRPGPDTFIWLACRLGSDEAARREMAAKHLCMWLGAEDGTRSRAAFDAAVLFPGAELHRALRAFFHADVSARATVLDIWHKQGRGLPEGLVNRIGFEKQDSSVQAIALRCAADDPETGLDMFRGYYAPLLTVAAGLAPNVSLLVESIRGGMLRGDPDCVPVLRRAIELSDTSEARYQLLRLAALQGDPEFYPMLREYRGIDADRSCRLLALFGRREVVEELKSGLGDPRSAVSAEAAWRWLTGERLPARPRLSVVGNDDGAESERGSGGTIVDGDAAARWWDMQQENWSAEDRWIDGVPMTTQVLLERAGKWGGQDGQDVLDLLATRLGRPLGCLPFAWQQVRLNVLARLATRESAIPPDREHSSLGTNATGAGNA